MLEDARFALRTLVKRPTTSLLLVTTLALGLAANAVIFNVLDAVVLRAFAFPNQERLVRLHETSRDFDGIDLSNVAPGNLIDWQAQSGGASRPGGRHRAGGTRACAAAKSPSGSRVTASGRASSRRWASPRPRGGASWPRRRARGRTSSVVLGHALWQRAFGGEPMLGRSVTIDTEPHVVVGIAPPGFQFPDGAEVWAPLVLPDPATARRDQRYLSAMGRLAAGTNATGSQRRARRRRRAAGAGAPEDEQRPRRGRAELPLGLRRPGAAADPGDLAGGRRCWCC